MTRALIVAVVIGLAPGFAGKMARPADPPPPVEWRLVVTSYGLGPDVVATEEILSRAGRTYRFRTGTVEVVVVDAARRRVELVDLGRKVQAEITFEALDEAVVKLKARLEKAIDDRRGTGKRADAVEADMTQDLIAPRFRRTELPRVGRVRLANPSVEIDADGEADPDAGRLASIARSLVLEAKLGAFRTPDDLPPFPELEALGALEKLGLRPREISYLYRLAGPPRRFRRAYRLVPELTVREREAVARVDKIREVAPLLRYERYSSPK